MPSLRPSRRVRHEDRCEDQQQDQRPPSIVGNRHGALADIQTRTQEVMVPQESSPSSCLILGKLYSLISDNDANISAVHWRGAAFVISSPEHFASNIIPKYFAPQVPNLDSFTKILLDFGFQKFASDSGNEIAFRHESFLQNRPDLLQQITTTRSNAADKENTSTPSNSTPAAESSLHRSRDDKASPFKDGGKRRTSDGDTDYMSDWSRLSEEKHKQQQRGPLLKKDGVTTTTSTTGRHRKAETKHLAPRGDDTTFALSRDVLPPRRDNNNKSGSTTRCTTGTCNPTHITELEDHGFKTFEETIFLPPKGSKIGANYITDTKRNLPFITECVRGTSSCFEVLLDPISLDYSADIAHRVGTWVLSIDGRSTRQTILQHNRFGQELSSMQRDGQVHPVQIVFARDDAGEWESALDDRQVTVHTSTNDAPTDVALSLHDLSRSDTCNPPEEVEVKDGTNEYQAPNKQLHSEAPAKLTNDGMRGMGSAVPDESVLVMSAEETSKQNQDRGHDEVMVIIPSNVQPELLEPVNEEQKEQSKQIPPPSVLDIKEQTQPTKESTIKTKEQTSAVVLEAQASDIEAAASELIVASDDDSPMQGEGVKIQGDRAADLTTSTAATRTCRWHVVQELVPRYYLEDFDTAAIESLIEKIIEIVIRTESAGGEDIVMGTKTNTEEMIRMGLEECSAIEAKDHQKLNKLAIAALSYSIAKKAKEIICRYIVEKHYVKTMKNLLFQSSESVKATIGVPREVYIAKILGCRLVSAIDDTSPMTLIDGTAPSDIGGVCIRGVMDGSVAQDILGTTLFRHGPIIVTHVNGSQVSLPSQVTAYWKDGKKNPTTDGMSFTLCMPSEFCVGKIKQAKYIVPGSLRRMKDGSVIKPDAHMCDSDFRNSVGGGLIDTSDSRDKDGMARDIDVEDELTEGTVSDGPGDNISDDMSDGDGLTVTSKSSTEDCLIEPETGDPVFCRVLGPSRDHPAPIKSALTTQSMPMQKNRGAISGKVSFHGGDDSSSEGLNIASTCVTKVNRHTIGSEVYDDFVQLETGRNAPEFAANRKKGDDKHKSHSWVERYDNDTNCKGCKTSKERVLFCQLCEICRCCGRKHACKDQSNANSAERKSVDRFDQAKMLRRTYNDALKRAFGLAHSYTTHIDVDNDRNDKYVENCSDGRTVTNMIAKQRKVDEKASLASVLALLEHDINLINVPFGESGGEHEGRSALFAAVLQSDHESVLNLLMKGANPRQKDAKKRRPLDCARLLVSESKKSSRNISREQKESLQSKELVVEILEIFVASQSLFEKSRTLRSYVTIEIKVKNAANVRVTSLGADEAVPDAIFCKVKWCGKDKGKPTPSVAVPNHTLPMQTLDWSNSSKGYQMRMNSDLPQTFKGMDLEVILCKGSYQKSIVLSATTQPGEELLTNASDSEIMGMFELNRSKFLEPGCQLGLSLRRLPRDFQYEEDKRRVFTDELFKIVGRLENLQTSLGPTQRVSLLSKKLLPLHCAVWLESTVLVQKILSMSVDPNEPGEYSTSPLDIASSIDDPSEEMEEILRLFGKKQKTRSQARVDESVLICFNPDVLPMLVPNWMEAPGTDRCRFFHTKEGCRSGSRCRWPHVFVPGRLPTDQSGSLLLLETAYQINFGFALHQSQFEEKAFHGRDGQSLWYTSALKCPVDRTIFYAKEGRNGRCSRQQVYWYPSKEEALDAVAAVVLESFSRRKFGQQEENRSSDSRRSVKRKLFQAPVEQREAKRNRFAEPDPSNLPPSIRNLSPHVPRIVKRIEAEEEIASVVSDITDVEGNSGRSYASYTSFSDPAVPIRRPDTLNRDDLPLLSTPNPRSWMLSEPKRHPCFAYLNRGFSGCQLGKDCSHAHVFKRVSQSPQVIHRPGGLAHAYRVHMNTWLRDDDFIRMSRCSRSGQTLFTSALRCPVEETIYCAEGGGGVESNQGIFWYASQRSADSAVETIVLTALKDRGCEV